MAISKTLRMQILRRDNYTCQSCGAKAPDVVLQIDHVVPVALGGTDEPSNLRTLCDACNSGKAATPPDAATVAQVSEDAVRWARAMQVAADQMLDNLEARNAARAAFDKKWLSWGDGRPIPRPENWALSVDAFIRAGLPLPVLLDCVDIAMSARHVKAAGVFKYMCGIAWNKVNELQRATANFVGASTNTPGYADHPSLTEALYALTQPEIEFYGDIAKGVISRLNLTVDEDALAGAIAQAEIEYSGRRIDLIKEYLESYVQDGMRFWKQAHREWLKHDPRTDPDDPEVWELAAKLAADDETTSQYAWSYFQDLDAEERESWIRYCKVAGLADGLTEGQAEVAASRLAYEISQHQPLPDGMCTVVGDTAIRLCFNKSAFRVTFQNCPACPENECTGRHQLCEHHLEIVLDGGLRRLIVQDYAAITVGD